MKSWRTLIGLGILIGLVLGLLDHAGAAPLPQGGSIPSIVINEIMQNPAAVSDANGEWFELYNAGDTDVDINGWTIRDNDSDSHTIDNGGPLIIPAGGYLVLGRNGDPNTNGGVAVDYVYSSFILANGDDEIILLDGDNVEIDRVEYDGGPEFPDPNGASMELIDPALDNNVGDNWQEATTPYGDGDLGTPGGPNGEPAEPTPTPTPPPTPSLEVVISEVAWMGTAASANDEWIELYNNTDEEIDLTGWTLAAADGTPSIALEGSIPPHGFFLLERSDDNTVSDLPADQIYTGALSNSGESLELRDAGGALIDTANGDGGAWPGGANPSGDPGGRASMERVDPTAPDTDDNWTTNDGVHRNGLDANGEPINGTPKEDNSPWLPEPTCVVIRRGDFGNVADAYVWSAFPQGRFNWVKLFTGSADHPKYGYGEKLTLISFDLSFLPEGAHITSARLGLRQFNSGSGGTVSIHRTTVPWDEQQVSWNSFAEGYDSTRVWGSFIAQGKGEKTVDLTDLVRAWVEEGVANYGMTLKGDSTTGFDVFFASEIWVLEKRPWLEVCYTP